jgi:uncharacterized membrane protein YqjE
VTAGGPGDPLSSSGPAYPAAPPATPASSGAHSETRSTETRSLGEIVGEITTDLSDLFKAEVELAKTELKQEAARTGKAAGMLGAAGFAGFMLVLFLSITLMWLLDNVIKLEFAALIVALLWGIAAAVLYSVGRKNLKKANPQLPQTQQTLKEDAQWAKAQRS